MRSIRIRLLATLALGLTALLIGTAVFLDSLTRHWFYAEFDAHLAAGARGLTSMVEHEQEGVEFAPDPHELAQFEGADPPDYFQIWHSDGEELRRSALVDGFELPRIVGTFESPAYRAETLPSGCHVRMVGIQFLPQIDDEYEGEPPSDSMRSAVQLVLARDTRDLVAAIQSFRQVIGVVFITALAAGGIGMSLVVKHGLRPLKRISDQLGRLNEERLSQRIVMDRVPAEVAPIVDTLNALLERLESVFVRECAFSSDVAHELRTPLAGLHTTLEVALSKPRESAEYRVAMDDCLAICRQMESMVETLLLVARLESDQEAVCAQRVVLSDLMKECWETLGSDADRRDLRVSWQLARSTAVETDPGKIRIVLNNLYDNAISHTDEHGTISIQSHINTKSFTLQINNAASAVSPEQADRVFDRFWQADPARNSTGRHFGLGLGLCKRIVERLGGSIHVRCNDGQFQVRVDLPQGQVGR